MLNLSPKKIKATKQSNKLKGLRVLHTPKAAKVLSRWLLIIMGIFLIVLFLPWQQNITATGSVTAFSPEDRPQTVETAIAGRIEQWFFQEGDFVNEGDTLVELSEIKSEYFDPNLLERLAEQMEALQENIQAKEERIDANKLQVEAMREALQLQNRQQRNLIQQVKLKLQTDSAELAAGIVNFEIAEQQFLRQENLYEQGLISLRKLEDHRTKLQQAKAKLVELENQYFTTKNELANARIQMSTIQADYAGKINNSLANLNKAQSDLQASIQSLASLETEYANMLIRREQQYLQAPQSGFVVRASQSGIGETVKEGEALLMIMPENPKLAVELYVRPMDVPWIKKGKQVRVEFAGWPAIQFPGRPNMAVGTFGGIVRVVDRVQTKEREGKFRVLVTEDPEDEPWPKTLGIGTGVWGWILLDTVPVWFEIWRQLNGFPPRMEEGYDKDAKQPNLRR